MSLLRVRKYEPGLRYRRYAIVDSYAPILELDTVNVPAHAHTWAANEANKISHTYAEFGANFVLMIEAWEVQRRIEHGTTE